MLKACSDVLLLTDVESFAERYKSIAESMNVSLDCESEWNENFRINYDRVILSSKFLPCVNRAYYDICTLILREDEKPALFIRAGVESFIFNWQSDKELAFAFFIKEKELLHCSQQIENILHGSKVTSFCMPGYKFDFAKNRFFYQGKQIFIAEAQKKYLAEWLLNGYKDNGKRQILYSLRKKFGKEFLHNIDRNGQIRS